MKRFLSLLLVAIMLCHAAPMAALATDTPQAVAEGPVILTQPTSDTAAIGEKATVFVEAQGEGLSYQWYYRDAGRTAFTKSTVQKSTYTLTVTERNVARELYCVITDAAGNTVTTDTVKLLAPTVALAITTQPVSDRSAIGEKATVFVEAQGEGLSYQWYYRDAGQTAFTKSTVQKSTYALTVTQRNVARELYCVVTDLYGNTVTTDTVKLLTSKDAPIITVRPVSDNAAIGEKATVFVEAQGEGLSYQWYYRDAGRTAFTKSTVQKSTYTLTVTERNVARELYCVITDAAGNTVTTDTVKLLASKDAPVITVRPVSDSAAIGEKATVFVEAQGEGLSYQWYYRDEGQTAFTKSTVQKSTYTLTVTERNVARELYCVVTDNHGRSVTTQIVPLLLPLRESLAILYQPLPRSAEVGEKATLQVEAKGEGLSYQWYYRDAGKTAFTKSTVQKDTYTITVTESNRNRVLYCVITDAHGNTVTTNTVSLVSVLTAAKQVSVPPSVTVNTGELVTYTISVTNQSSQARTVTVTDTLPTNTTLAEGGDWTLEGRTLHRSVTVPAGETVALSYTVRVNEDASLLLDGVLSAEEATVDGVVLPAYPVYIRRTLTRNDADYLRYAILALQDSGYTGQTLLKWIYQVAYSKSPLVTESPAATLQTLFDVPDTAGNDLRKTVAPTLYGGTAIAPEADAYFTGGRAQSICEEALTVGDVLIYEDGEFAYIYLYFDGLLDLTDGYRECDTGAVLTAANRAARYAVIRPSMGFPTVRISEGMTDPRTLSPDQQALYVTALNYLLLGERLQYDDTRLSNISGSEFRWKKGATAPEGYTADQWGYINCAAFCYDLYYFGLGMDIRNYTTAALLGRTEWRTYYYRPEGTVSEDTAAKEMATFFATLQPGDIVIIRRDTDGNGTDDTGHAVCCIGDGKAIQSNGSSYSYATSVETYEPSIRFMDLYSYLFDPASANYVFDSTVSKLAIIRPLKSFTGTVSQESLNRVEGLGGIRIEKLASHKPYVSANAGDEITFTFRILNANAVAKVINVTDVIPANTQLIAVSGGTADGASLSFCVTAEPGATVTVSYTVKVSDTATAIVSNSAKANGVSIPCHTVSVRRTLTATEQERIRQAIADYARNNPEGLSGIRMIKAIYEKAGLPCPFASANSFADVKSGIIGKSIESSSKYAVALLKNGAYRGLVVDGLYGGRHYFTKELAFLNGGNRVRLPKEENLVIGDVILAVSSTSEKVYIYNGEYLVDVSASAFENQDPNARLERLMAFQHYFVVLRPSFG